MRRANRVRCSKLVASRPAGATLPITLFFDDTSPDQCKQCCLICVFLRIEDAHAALNKLQGVQPNLFDDIWPDKCDLCCYVSSWARELEMHMTTLHGAKVSCFQPPRGIQLRRCLSNNAVQIENSDSSSAGRCTNPFM